MRKVVTLAALVALSHAAPSRSEDLGDDRLIDLWRSQKAICRDGDEESPDTWMACGRSDAFAAVLAARGMCLDAGQEFWRVGNARPNEADEAWRCSLVTS